MDDGIEKPIAYGSRTLHKHERNYAQIDKEALAIIFGICKFRQYVYGRRLSIMTDHKPLLGLLQADKQTPAVMSPRMLRWSIMLNAYDYKLEYRPGNKLKNADGLSRLPEVTPEMCIPELAEVLLLESPLDIPYSAKDIAKATDEDTTLNKIKDRIMKGWPEKEVDEALRPFWTRRTELSIHKECILWGNRVVVPSKLRMNLLELLHAVHQGIVNTKAIARSYIWWPGMDAEIERRVKLCKKCMELQNNPKKEQASWQRPENPWSRIHIDFAGPFHGKTFLLVVDAHSGWPEVEIVNTTSSAAAIKKIRKMFATHGLPDILVSDNGTAFTSSEFAKFVEINGVRHIKTAPFHPATNGTAERMVQVLKKMLRKLEEGDWETRLDRVLFAIRTTPRATTGKSPAEMLMNRQPQTHWHKLQPRESREWMQDNKAGRIFGREEPVYVRNYVQAGVKWLPGKVVQVKGRCHYRVQLENGKLVNRHLDQMMSRVVDQTMPEVKIKDTASEQKQDEVVQGNEEDTFPNRQDEVLPETGQTELPGRGQSEKEKCKDKEVKDVQESRRSTRVKKKPSRLADFI